MIKIFSKFSIPGVIGIVCPDHVLLLEFHLLFLLFVVVFCPYFNRKTIYSFSVIFLYCVFVCFYISANPYIFSIILKDHPRNLRSSSAFRMGSIPGFRIRILCNRKIRIGKFGTELGPSLQEEKQ